MTWVAMTDILFKSQPLLLTYVCTSTARSSDVDLWMALSFMFSSRLSARLLLRGLPVKELGFSKQVFVQRAARDQRENQSLQILLKVVFKDRVGNSRNVPLNCTATLFEFIP